MSISTYMFFRFSQVFEFFYKSFVGREFFCSEIHAQTLGYNNRLKINEEIN